jgi:hypothetical protein
MLVNQGEQKQVKEVRMVPCHAMLRYAYEADIHNQV